MNLRALKTRARSLRILTMAKLLQRDPSLTVTELGDHFGVSGRTIRRDLAILREVGEDLFCDRCLTAFSGVATGHVVRPSRFTEDWVIVQRSGLACELRLAADQNGRRKNGSGVGG